MYDCDGLATVLSCKDGKLELEMSAEACGSCGVQSICGRSRKLTIPYLNAENFAPGEKLIIRLSSGSGLKLVLLVFGMGLLLACSVAVLANSFWNSELIGAAALVLTVVLWLIIAAKLIKAFSRLTRLDLRRVDDDYNEKR